MLRLFDGPIGWWRLITHRLNHRFLQHFVVTLLTLVFLPVVLGADLEDSLRVAVVADPGTRLVCARGVHRATMAGLVVALSGIYFTARLRRLADRETSRLMDGLTLHEPRSEGQNP